MQPALKVQALVQPGHQLEIVLPELPEGASVEVIVLLPPAAPRPGTGVLDFLDSLPPGPRSAASWEELDRQFQQERDAWER